MNYRWTIKPSKSFWGFYGSFSENRSFQSIKNWIKMFILEVCILKRNSNMLIDCEHILCDCEHDQHMVRFRGSFFSWPVRAEQGCLAQCDVLCGTLHWISGYLSLAENSMADGRVSGFLTWKMFYGFLLHDCFQSTEVYSTLSTINILTIAFALLANCC